MSVIVPAILTNDALKAQSQINALSGLVDLAQVDFMDGQFVDTVSITADEAGQLTAPYKLEAHLMVMDPAAWLPYFQPEQWKRIYFHIEAVPEPADLISMIKQMEIEPGLAINPETPLAAIEDYTETIDNVLFMGVTPGAQGRAFHPEVLEKINEFLNQHPDHLVALDGGASKETIEQIAKVGVFNITVGSAIFGGGDVRQNLRVLQELAS
ncbi:MAG: ribulose-phosphate 3-epimerase [Patescibacteria group bacterium]|nr:ribulose-phosphate 3-epimerase [Patescibacteria group bacterium]MDD5715403.1 ribulose-phosphate 3-epimerase [Patescibacteria group bacterium]